MHALLQRFNPSSWPIAGKLSFAFFLTAIVPIVLTAYYGMKETLSRVNAQERRDLAEQADQTAQRIERALTGAKRSLDLLQQPVFLEALEKSAATPTGASRKPGNLQPTLLKFVSANSDIELILVFNRKGVVVEATSAEYVGRDFRWRGYVDAALAGRRFVSGYDIGSQTGLQGIYVAMPLRTAAGDVIGGAAVKLTSVVVESALTEARRRPSVTPMLIDAEGIIAWHPEASQRFHSLMPLDEAVAARVKKERRYGEREISALAASELAAVWRNIGVPTHAEFRWSPSCAPEVAGLARVQGAPLTVVLAEPKARWEAPLREVFVSVFSKVLLVTLVAGFAAFAIFTRDVIRPIRQLTRAAKAVKDGSLDVRARVVNDDEVGDLARTFNGMVSEIIERQRERNVFGRVVPPEVREKLLAGQIKLGGENRHVSVLFSDIRSFTTLCEGMRPEQVVVLLNEFLTEMTEAVKGHGGHVNNFLGDAIIVIFGAPDDHPDPAWGAVQAAFDMRGRLESLNERRRLRGDVEIVSGIGIGTGTVVAGQMGSLERFVYTVVGDAVNVASRLENLTKEFDGNPILVNGATAEALRGRDGVSVVSLGSHLVKGRTQEIQVYRIDWTLFE